jgi:glutathione S-transferase
MLTLYHAPQSRSSRFIWLLEELGPPYAIEYTDILRQDGSGASDPRNPHPDGKVPALVHDGVLVTESAAIALYLTDLFPQAGLAPAVGEPKRGAYVTWLAYYAGVIEPVLIATFSGVGDAPWATRSWRTMEKMHERITQALSGGDYMLGERFSALDVIMGSLGQFYRAALPEGALIDNYLKRTADRPALARALAKDSPATR